MPSVDDFYHAFEKSAKENIPVICICITKKFSGSLQSATVAKGMIEEKYPQAKITVIDSTINTVLQGLFVLEACRLRDMGMDYEEIIEKISGGWFDFDTLIATPDCMGMLGKLGRVLGPKGLMPNPKTGTVTMDVAKAVKDAKAGKVEYRADKQGMIHCPVGKIEFSEEDLLKNYATLADAILRAKPASAKGTFVKSIYLSTTMGPGIKLDPKNFAAEVKDLMA